MLVLAMQFSRIAWRRERPAPPMERPASSLPEREILPHNGTEIRRCAASTEFPGELNLRLGVDAMPTNQ